MPVETLTYAALGARLMISAGAARSLAKRLRLPRSLSDDGKVLVNVDLAEIRHTRRPRGSSEAGNVAPPAAKILALQAQITRLEATAASHRVDFMFELLQATAETMAAKETTARLEGLLRTSGRIGRAIDSHGIAARRPGLLTADLVAADRNAHR
jgi:hypothetical protein